MTGCKIIEIELTRLIFVLPLRGGLLLVLIVVRDCLGFGLSPSLLLGSFALAFGLGSPSCRLLASISFRLIVRLPGFSGGQQTVLNKRFLLFGILQCL